MKRTVFFAGCAIALAGSAGAAVDQAQEPYVMSFNEFVAVADMAGWTLPVGEESFGQARGASDTPLMQLARRGADDGPGDDNDGRGGDSDDSSDDDSSDDDGSGSGRDRPRIPGGSGCDDPGDVQEHAACRG